MARTTSDIVIDARPERIMDVIADLESYPRWATGVSAVDILSQTSDGRPRQVRMTLDSPPIRDSYVIEYTWHGPARVTWVLCETGTMLSQLDGAYDLAPAADGTQVTYQLEVDLTIPLLGRLKRKAEKVIIDTALRGLKRHVEDG